MKYSAGSHNTTHTQAHSCTNAHTDEMPLNDSVTFTSHYYSVSNCLGEILKKQHVQTEFKGIQSLIRENYTEPSHSSKNSWRRAWTLQLLSWNQFWILRKLLLSKSIKVGSQISMTFLTMQFGTLRPNLTPWRLPAVEDRRRRVDWNITARCCQSWPNSKFKKTLSTPTGSTNGLKIEGVKEYI